MNKCVCNFFERNKKPLFVFGVALFLWLSLESHWLLLFNKYVLPYIGFNDNAVISGIIFSLVLAGSFYCLCSKFFHYRYVLSLSKLLFLAFISILCIRYRFLHHYVFSYLVWTVSYVDVIEVCIFIIGIWSVFNYGYCRKQKKKFDAIPKPLLDKAIIDVDDDKFNFTPAVVKFLEELDQKSFTTSFNMGLVASWGTGKTSFMNLFEKKIANMDYIFVRFNPRHSLKPLDIQADFFAELYSELKKYNSQFSFLFKDYMKAIGVVDRSNIIQSITLLMAIGDVDRDKERISHAIARLPKRVIVFIDDLDRLTREECMEVFKLMDCRAAFSNLIFISAYDRDVISKLLDDNSSDDKHPKFHEKYFTLEHHLPTTEYLKIYDYLKRQLTEKEGYDLSIIEAVYSIIKPHLTTIRDVIRFLPNFKNGYNLVRNNVNLKDYLLVSIIKFKYLDEFKKLASMEFLERQTRSNFFHLKSNTLDEETKISPYDYSKIQSYNILKELFPTGALGKEIPNIRAIFQYCGDLNPSSCRIANVFAFSIYMNAQVGDRIGFDAFYNTLSWERFETIKQQVEKWYNDIGSTKTSNVGTTSDNMDDIGKHWELVFYLGHCELDAFENKLQFENYVRIIFHLINKYGDYTLYPSRLVHPYRLYFINEKYNYKDDEYKIFIQSLMQNNDHEYGIIQNLIEHMYSSDQSIFSKDELLTIAKGNLQRYIAENPLNSTETMDQYIVLLKECVTEGTLDPKGTTPVKYESDACKLVREQIDLAPDMYFDNFIGYDPMQITCDPIFLQLFGSEKQFEEYINEECFDEVKNANKVRAFWKYWKQKKDNKESFTLFAADRDTFLQTYPEFQDSY